MKKIFSFVAAALFAGSMFAAEYEWESLSTTSFSSEDNVVSVYATKNFSVENKQMTQSTTKLNGIKFANSANSNMDTSYVQISATGEISELTLATSSTSTGAGKKVGIVFFDDAACASTNVISATEFVSFSKDSAADSRSVITVPANTVAVRIYRKVTVSGTNYGEGSSVWLYYINVTVGQVVSHSVTYDLGAGTGTAPTQADVAEGRKFDVASFEGCTAPEGMEFNGWNDGTKTYAAGDEYTMGSADVTLTAQYKTYVPKHIISFYVDGTLYETQIVNEGSYGNMPNEPTKELHNFAGWFNGEDQYYFNNPITADLTLTAHFDEMDNASDLDFEMFVGYNGKDDDLVKYFINYCNFSYNLSANDGLDSLDANKTKNNYQFLGMKLKTNGSYLIGKVAAGKRVDLVLGQLKEAKVLINDVEAAAPNGGVAADSTAGHTYYDFRQAGTFKVLCTSGNTTVIKAIKFSELPAVSDDATLSALTLNGVAIAGFAATKTSYKVTLAEGTTELPVVVATATDANATVSTVNYSTIEDYAATATFSVTAEDGTTVVNYTINFTIEKPVQYLQAPYESVMTADFELPEWLRGCEVNLNYMSSDTAVIADQENRHHVIRFNATDTISMYIESCDSVILDLSATGGRTVAMSVAGEEVANSGSFKKNTLKTLGAYIHSKEPVIVKIYGVDVTGGTTISRIKVTEYKDSPTGLMNNAAATKAVKVVENGQIVIIKNGVRYNAVGAKL